MTVKEIIGKILASHELADSDLDEIEQDINQFAKEQLEAVRDKIQGKRDSILQATDRAEPRIAKALIISIELINEQIEKLK